MYWGSISGIIIEKPCDLGEVYHLWVCFFSVKLGVIILCFLVILKISLNNNSKLLTQNLTHSGFVNMCFSSSFKFCDSGIYYICINMYAYVSSFLLAFLPFTSKDIYFHKFMINLFLPGKVWCWIKLFLSSIIQVSTSEKQCSYSQFKGAKLHSAKAQNRLVYKLEI